MKAPDFEIGYSREVSTVLVNLFKLDQGQIPPWPAQRFLDVDAKSLRIYRRDRR